MYFNQIINIIVKNKILDDIMIESLNKLKMYLISKIFPIKILTNIEKFIGTSM